MKVPSEPKPKFRFDPSKAISKENEFDAGAYVRQLQTHKSKRMPSQSNTADVKAAILTPEEETEAAHCRVVSDEIDLNGAEINWRYWVHQLPALNAAQAAFLMSALEPDLYSNLNHRPGANDPTKNIDKARKIQRLAEADGIHMASPTDWVEWSRNKGIHVHLGLLMAIWELPEVSPHILRGEEEAKASTPNGDNGVEETPAERRSKLDITRERGTRRRILENWDDIQKLNGKYPDGIQVKRFLDRNENTKKSVLKTIQNHLSTLRKGKLIP